MIAGGDSIAIPKCCDRFPLMIQGILARSAFVMAGAGALAAVPAAVAAKEPLLLAPSSKWHVDYATDSCRLARTFGTGQGRVSFVLDRFQPGAMVHMTLTGKPVGVHSDVRTAVIRSSSSMARCSLRVGMRAGKGPSTRKTGKMTTIQRNALFPTLILR